MSRTSPTCPACEASNLKTVGAIPEGYQFAGRPLDKAIPGGVLYKCRMCHLAFRWPRLEKNELNLLYQQAKFGVWTYDPEKRRDWVLTKEVLNQRLRGGKLLDIGCFDGAFLSFMNENTSEWDLSGIELNKSAAEIASKKGIEILGTDAEDLQNQQIVFDAIVAFDVVEHLHNPTRFLKSISELVRKNGFIILSTGNADSISWRFMGSRYWYCSLPEHLCFISPAWCNHIASLLNLQVVEINSFSHSQNRRIGLVVSETLKNVLYRLFPYSFRLMRKKGLGGVNVSENPQLADTPPIWISSKDQFMVVFKKI